MPNKVMSHHSERGRAVPACPRSAVFKRCAPFDASASLRLVTTGVGVHRWFQVIAVFPLDEAGW